MTHSKRLIRDDTITEVLKAMEKALANEAPTPQAIELFAAVKALRDGSPLRMAAPPINYLRAVQERALHADNLTATIETPIGVFGCTRYPTVWKGKRGRRNAWSSFYSLNGNPITLAEIKSSGLAAPTIRPGRKPKH